MPTYEYACTSCGDRFEAVQSFSDPSLTSCPACGGTLRKVFGNVGIVLKGSGFYKTDSRNGSNGSAKAKEKKESSSSSSPESSPKSDGGGGKESSSTTSTSPSAPEKAAAASTSS